MRFWSLLSGAIVAAAQAGTREGQTIPRPIATPSPRSDQVSKPEFQRYMTPREYQRRFRSGGVFEAMSYREELAAHQAASQDERRSDMVAGIRGAMVATGSTIDIKAVDRVLAAIGRIRREAFVPHAEERYAYLPFPTQIGHGQTISDAYIVALMATVADIHPGDAVLDVGTGSGYQAAVLSALGADVTSIEIVKPLASEARNRLRDLGMHGVTVVTGDGYGGVPRSAPYDAIIVAAGTGAPPKALLDQLKIGGRLGHVDKG